MLQSNNVTNPQIDTATNRFSAGQNYVYDKNGNLTQDAEGRQFLYNAENHQKEVKNASNQTVGEYLYDGEGKRVKKISSTETTVFVYDGKGQLAAEYSTETAQTPQTSYLTTDHLGSPRVITNELGEVTTRKDYMAFGEETYTQQRTTQNNYDNQSETRKGYTGYEKDDESGLDFAQARYYNSAHGRFTSVDPLTASATLRNPQTFNRYSYALNSPYKFTDPLGLIVSCCKAKDIEKQIRKDFGTGWVDGKLVMLDEKSLKKIVKALLPFYTQAAMAGRKAQQQLNRASKNPVIVTKITTQETRPGAVKQTSSSNSTNVGLGGKINESVETKESADTGGAIAGEFKAAGEQGYEGKIDASSSDGTTTTKAEPTTVTTTEAVPNDALKKAENNLAIEEEKMLDLGEKAASALNNLTLSGSFIDIPAVFSGGLSTNPPTGPLYTEKNAFDLEPKLMNMFIAGRDSVKPKK